MSSSSSDTMSSKTRKSTALETVIEQWQTFNLDGRRNDLDSHAQAIAEIQDSSLQLRKKLAESTREFRKVEEESKLKKFPFLLKKYQEQIDVLTRRSKTSEGAYLSLYKVLANIADPVAALNSASVDDRKSGRINNLEMQNRKLQQELEEFRKEFQDIQNQEVTIKRLEEKVKGYDTSMETLVTEKTKKIEAEIRGESERKEAAAHEKEMEFMKQIQSLERELNAAQHSQNTAQSQSFDVKRGFEEEQNARQSEYDLLADELERARGQITTLERERDILTEKSKRSARSTAPSPDQELFIAQKEIEVSHLQEQLAHTDALLQAERTRHREDQQKATAEAQARKEQARALEKELRSKPSQEEIDALRRQLRVFEALEYNVIDTGHLADGDEHQQVERLLREKSRHLETENMKLKVELKEQEEALDSATRSLTHANKKVQDQTELIGKLEDDITRSGSSTTSSFGSLLVGQKGVPVAAAAAAGAQTASAKSASMETAPPFHAGPGGSVVAGLATASNTAHMLHVVTNQRDRFKALLNDMEATNRRLTSDCTRLKEEIQTLSSDNVKLYEKIKYLESYGGQTTIGSGGQGGKGGTTSSSSTVVDMDPAVDRKYKSMYEDSVNPFVLFNRKIKSERYRSLNAAEKVTLNMGQFFLSNKHSRTFLFCYALLLHGLVFFTLYHFASEETHCYVEVDDTLTLEQEHKMGIPG
eukprot:TRINITY_DN3467_c0_g2_i1.p1 TRINITY_DN3467_c0_g2~~TRINITY_DN3467_c0_g2_i1.p1  ORF type:complete len:705 (+),score=238.54 TRINITY_DN3467_c0_g2_i1:573-2687(+)